MIVASTSTVYGSDYLEYLLPELHSFYSNIEELLFIPYARPSGISYNIYTERVALFFKKLNIAVNGIHEFKQPKLAVQKAQAIFIGGGNTFELVNQLYKNDIIEVLQKAIGKGVPYLGTSAGSNICGVSMMNTNDMPIVYPPSFKTLGCFPFNINAHYLDVDKTSTHMGETRETRIQEFHVFNDTPVLGLREGSWLVIEDEQIVLRGNSSARIFQPSRKPLELKSGAEVKF